MELRKNKNGSPLHLFTSSLKEALLSYLEIVQTGVRGIVTDEKGEPLANANIEISGISYTEKQRNITTSAFGEYWRLLAPGKYW